MRIAQEHIEHVRSAIDIVELVGEYVRLKKQGSNFIGLCPFHDEKTPSFNVNPGMGIFKCFGCDAGGDAFKFVMQIENLSFPESIRLLAERAGIELPESGEESQQISEIESIHYALKFAGRHFYTLLTQTDEGRPGLDYLVGRGFEPETIKKYGLGYAGDQWEGLLTAAQKEHIEPRVLEQAGLVVARREKSGYFDRYRGRVMFPIFSHMGKVIGFGGRILKPAENQAKYINSPETPVYHKSKVLYGLYQGKQAIRKKEEAILVEGYTDVLSLHQAGIKNAVASSGTALTIDQVKLIKRYAKRVLIIYDADSAGAKAALRGIELCLQQSIAVYGLELPEGEDPDSFVRKEGAKAFEDFMETHKKDFIAFMHDLAKKKGQVNTPEGQAQLTREIVTTIAMMPDITMHEPFIRRASDVLDVPDIPLFEVLEQVLKDKRHGRKPARDSGYMPSQQVPTFQRSANVDQGEGAHPTEKSTLEESSEQGEDPLPQEKMLLRIMLKHGLPMVEYIMGNMALNEFSKGIIIEAVQNVLTMYESGQVDASPFLNGVYGARLQELAAEIMMQRYEPSENWARRQNISIPRFNEDPHMAAASAMKQLKRRRVDDGPKTAKSPHLSRSAPWRGRKTSS